MDLKRVLVGLALLLTVIPTFSQSHQCATMEIWRQHVADDPRAADRKAQSEAAIQNWLAANPDAERTAAVITIPVVVHVVYNTPQQNISLAQIQSQIATLNLDYRLHNADSVPLGHPFWPHTADSEIEFCLATIDPNGNPTTGVTRTSTTNTVFQGNNIDDIKFTSFGGHDNWDPTRYLNIWVCNLGTDLLGYATFPSELATDPDYDGVVINYTAFGNMGTASAPSDLGRTATHEIGHWLNLYHIWGDATCGDDLVSDTEVAEQENYGCPTFPFNANSTCGSGPNGEMFMNYMDYVDDNCMNMFTFGQKNRMRAALNTERIGLLTSGACGASVGVSEAHSSTPFDIFPNPTSGSITIETHHSGFQKATVSVTNSLGVQVLRESAVTGFPHTIDLSTLPGDLYLVQVRNGKQQFTQKVILTH